MDQLPDPKLVELAQAGDQHAFAELYSRYFDPVYDFVAHMTRNRDEAADIAQDTFLKAMNALGGLQKGASFKGWIFTIARNTALNRLERASRTRPLAFEDAEGEEVSFDVVDTDRFSDPEEAAQANAVAALVWAAAAGLDPKQLSLLDLHLRQGLDSGEIADVLGVTKNNGYVMLNRLKKAVEDSIGAFIMWKDGRQYCADLNAALSQADIHGMSPEVRKVVDRHVAHCQVCEERKKELAPLAAFAGLGAIGAPMGAKAHILDGLMQQWPGPAAGAPGNAPYTADDRQVNQASADGAGSGRGGSYTTGGTFFGRGSFIKVGAGLGLLAAALFALLFFPVSPIALTRGDSGTAQADNGGDPPSPGAGGPTATSTTATSRAFVSPSPNPSASPPPGASASPSTAAGPSSTPTKTNTPVSTPGQGTPTFTPTSTSTNTPTPTSTSAATSTPTSIPTVTPTACVATIARFGSGPLTIAPGQSSSFVVSNTQGCAAAYSVSPDPSAPWLTVTGGGTLPAFSQETVGVSVNEALVPAGEGTYTGNITVTGPNNSFVVSVRTTVGGASPNVTLTSKRCTGSSVDFVAQASDDIGVTSVTLTYTLSTGAPGSHDMANTAGTATNGTWHVAFTLPPSVAAITITTFTITALDGGLHTDSVSGTCT